MSSASFRESVLSLVLCLAVATMGSAQEPSRLPPPPEEPTAVPPTPTAPPHWYERRGVGPAPTDPFQPAFAPPPIDFANLGDVYIRADLGRHAEIGFPEVTGFGLEVTGQLRLPHSPWISLLGTLRNEFQDGGDRFSWTAGIMGEWGPVTAGGGIDGIFDNRTDSNIGSGFFFVSYELSTISSRIGLWSTFTLWDDVDKFGYNVGPGTSVVVTTGVEPLEHTSVFFAKAIGPEGRWGAVYVAPGIEHEDARFRFSVGYQGTIVEHLDGFVHYHQTTDGDDDWSLFAGLQLHFGCGSSRPYDWLMPQRIRARQMNTTSVQWFF
jgi:hypothetical protein